MLFALKILTAYLPTCFLQQRFRRAMVFALNHSCDLQNYKAINSNFLLAIMRSRTSNSQSGWHYLLGSRRPETLVEF
ncbi:CLUMA_CG007669, isoform A [Clunio marinus]|uniref:CLUMA_CG007669, isoform A n=1 Tax=Clunio marinus TaxID=568069 RepID=A0A1J1I5F4_9DIPT|nr:CLUMA_CG007669, isoform A [Clunio marinus]